MTLGWRLIHKLSGLLEAAEREAVLGDFAEVRSVGLEGLARSAGSDREAPSGAVGGAAALAGPCLARRPGWIHTQSDFSRTQPGAPLQSQNPLEHGRALSLRAHSGRGDLRHRLSVAGACPLDLERGVRAGTLGAQDCLGPGALFSLGWSIFGVSLVFRARLPPGVGLFGPILFALLFLVPAVTFLFPSVLGARRGLRAGALETRQAITLAAVAIVVTGLTIWTGTWQSAALERWSEGAYHAKGVNWLALVPKYALLSWPVVYIVATSNSQPKRDAL